MDRTEKNQVAEIVRLKQTVSELHMELKKTNGEEAQAKTEQILPGLTFGG